MNDHINGCIVLARNSGQKELAKLAAAELADYELRLDLLEKGATWEHNENANLKEQLAQKDDALRLAREAVARLESIIRAARKGEYNNANEINAIRKFLSESMQEYNAWTGSHDTNL